MNRRYRVLVYGMLVAATACVEDPVRLPDLEEGSYRIQLRDPIISNEFVTPGWMWTEPDISFEIMGSALTVTMASGDLVPTGPPQFSQADGGQWVAHFSWVEKQDGAHYWLVNFSAEGCVSAVAVDADLGIGPGGVWEVPLRSCVLVPE